MSYTIISILCATFWVAGVFAGKWWGKKIGQQHERKKVCNEARKHIQNESIIKDQ